MKLKLKPVFPSDDYEVGLRRELCVFLSIETIFIFFLFSSEIFVPNKDMFYVHIDGFYEMIGQPVIFMFASVTLTALSLFNRWVYYFYEGIHAAVGVLLLVGFIGALPLGIVLFFLFSGRFLIYMNRMKSHTKNKDDTEKT